jgi:hypothetical protein
MKVLGRVIIAQTVENGGTVKGRKERVFARLGIKHILSSRKCGRLKTKPNTAEIVSITEKIVSSAGTLIQSAGVVGLFSLDGAVVGERR